MALERNATTIDIERSTLNILKKNTKGEQTNTHLQIWLIAYSLLLIPSERVGSEK